MALESTKLHFRNTFRELAEVEHKKLKAPLFSTCFKEIDSFLRDTNLATYKAIEPKEEIKQIMS